MGKWWEQKINKNWLIKIRKYSQLQQTQGKHKLNKQWDTILTYVSCVSCINRQILRHWAVLSVHWKDWCWSWNSNTLATWCEEVTHWKRPWCWKRLKAGGEGDDRRWDGWRASLTQCTWVWVNSRRCWWTGRPGGCGPWGCKESDTTERLNWTELNWTEAEKKPLTCTGLEKMLFWQYQMLTKKQKFSRSFRGEEKLVPLL